MISNITKGKTRKLFKAGCKNELVAVSYDNASAFEDITLKSLIPHKGVLLNNLNSFWMNYTHDIVPNFMLSDCSEYLPTMFRSGDYSGRCMLVKKLDMIPFEFTVSGYVTDEIWNSYKRTGSIAGIELPYGLNQSEQLSVPIFLTKVKNNSHKKNYISFSDMSCVLGLNLSADILDKCVELYLKCSAYAQKNGIILASAKFEFGLDENGVLTLAGDTLSPDSSLYWDLLTYKVGKPQKSYTKQFINDYLDYTYWDKKQSDAPRLPVVLIVETFRRYELLYKHLTQSNPVY